MFFASTHTLARFDWRSFVSRRKFSWKAALPPSRQPGSVRMPSASKLAKGPLSESSLFVVKESAGAQSARRESVDRIVQRGWAALPARVWARRKG